MTAVAKPPFNQVWNLIISLAGRQFQTKLGLAFTYKVRAGTVFPSRTAYQISRADFETAYELAPLNGPGKINMIVRGPSYVWAILHDQRVSGGAW